MRQLVNNQTIAYLGLGVMGGAMAGHLARAGCNISVWNRSNKRQSEGEAIQLGARRAESIADAVRSASIIFTCLPDVPDVEEVIFASDGVANNALPDSLIVDMSTIGPDFAREVSANLQKRGLRFMDAPFSGGDVGGRNATLTFIVGGEKADFDAVKPLLEIMGKTIRLCGPAGSGQAVKLCNQVMCAVNMLSVCEALKLAEAQGIDANLMVELCQTGAAGSWALSNLAPRILESDFSPGFVLDHMINNLRLVSETVERSGITLPATQLAEQVFKVVQEKNPGKRQGTHAMMRFYSNEPAGTV